MFDLPNIPFHATDFGSDDTQALTCHCSPPRGGSLALGLLLNHCAADCDARADPASTSNECQAGKTGEVP
jgi:hypothetical protein